MAVASNQMRNIRYTTYRNYSSSGLPVEDSQSQLSTCNYALHVLSVDVDVIAPTHRNSPSQSYLSPRKSQSTDKKNEDTGGKRKSDNLNSKIHSGPSRSVATVNRYKGSPAGLRHACSFPSYRGMLIDGQKWACEACIRGHRVSSCKHHGMN